MSRASSADVTLASPEHTAAPSPALSAGSELPSTKEATPSMDPDVEARLAKLKRLLAASTAFSSIIADRIKSQKQRRAAEALNAEKEEEAQKKNKNGKRKGGNAEPGSPSKRARVEDGTAVATSEPKDDDEKKAREEEILYMKQPATVTGATLRDYQLAGVQWLALLYENGLNGILADEMGLGKTLQTISFLSHLKEKGVWGPFLVVCPLSVLHNWKAEFEKFAPTVPVVIYHGNPEHRRELVRTRMALPTDLNSSASTTFPVVLTTFEMIIKDRNVLNKYSWSFVIIDEGHRLKNMESKLVQEIRTYPSANRLILTGTPLHNNLNELWSLLNFIMPKLFDDLSAFQAWFSPVTSKTSPKEQAAVNSMGMSAEENAQLITSLHAILKPFLLRRLKADVEVNLPPKKEYILYAPLTKQQLDLYQNVVAGGAKLREWIVKRYCGIDKLDMKTRKALQDRKDVVQSAIDEIEQDESIAEAVAKRRSRGSKKAVDYEEVEDDDFFEELEEEDEEEEEKRRQARQSRRNAAAAQEPSPEELGRDFAIKQAFQIVNNMHLSNKIMQLRKVCSHPFLFHWPTDSRTNSPVISDELVGASGKMLLLNRLLDELFSRKHKVLIFSQFTTMLDIIEDWATQFKGWDVCRIDGSTTHEERKSEMDRFNTGGEKPDACRLFLLSTKAGGLGINLVAADTVIFYDSDWNPQNDLQAQDRAHRIGQTRPVLIFRLVSAHTIETHILDRATQKRKLEALVIARGKFKAVGGRASQKAESLESLAASLLSLEGEKIDVVNSADDKIISDADLDVLLDRSPEVFKERGIGWGKEKASADGDVDMDGKQAQKTEGVAFKVFERPADALNDGLATLQDE
ncbi:hypothetical protein M407DRAFT_214347 [Tulasnella calospora MUT 4182]|uniref:Helicase ATP-binding domain-containing protein n=1 Tax=Tulasnella calospora MUT 4182 TaxID=1051891 RepID=A0A0C3QJE8_9AGAM|nr:hypothetical protein M407DRAFT_214347 [Tulasnella calospora MUT 4182]